MSGCIAGCQYIPSVEYFAHWSQHGLLLLEGHEHYQKRTWRNKTAIQGYDLPLILTVPLSKGKNNQLHIQKVNIAYDTPWQKNHLHSLKTAYGKTAFFDEVLPGLESIYRSHYEFLWNLNLDLLTYFTSFLRGNWIFEVTSTFQPLYAPTIVDLRKGVPGGAAQIEMESSLEYSQVQRIDKKHLPNLCILDALCHLGPETSDYLTRYGDKLYEKT
jgi:WbqC-like protein